jgi:hypothetical protein
MHQVQKVTQMNRQHNSTHQAISPISPVDIIPIIQSESPTAIILACTILIAVSIGGITGLVRAIIGTKKFR